jgi:hypothetical protein
MHPSYFIMLRRLPFLLFLLVPIFASLSAEAGRITNVSGKQVKLEIEDTEMNEGQKFFVMIDGKKKGVIVITKIAKGKALGKITKGRAEVDATIEPTTGAKTASADADPGANDDGGGKKKKRKKGKRSRDADGGGGPGTFVGVLGGYAMDSQTVKDAAGNSVAMAGGGYSLKGFGDMPLSGRVGAIARGGIEQLNLTGSGYTTAIMYATADVLIRFAFADEGFQPFVAGGLGIHFPLSKSSTILDVPRISSTTVFFIDLGFNYQMNEGMILVGALEYGLFPPSNDVSTSFITARFGAGWRF